MEKEYDFSKGVRGKYAASYHEGVNLDLPVWIIERLDQEARRLGVARQAVMKMFLAQHLERAG